MFQQDNESTEGISERLDSALLNPKSEAGGGNMHQEELQDK